LGRRIPERLADEVTARGMRRLRLGTNRALAEAGHLNEAVGFTEIEAFDTEQYAHRWFERDLGR
jgi:hypothetical protein